MAGTAGGIGPECKVFVVPQKIGCFMLFGTEERKICMAGFTRVRSLGIIMTGIARCHRGERDANSFFKMCNIAMARLTFSTLLDVECMREDKTTIFTNGDHILKRIAYVTRRTVLVQLFFMASLARRMVRAEDVRCQDALFDSTVTVRAPDSHILCV